MGKQCAKCGKSLSFITIFINKNFCDDCIKVQKAEQAKIEAELAEKRAKFDSDIDEIAKKMTEQKNIEEQRLHAKSRRKTKQQPKLDTQEDINIWLAQISKTQDKLTEEQAHILSKRLASQISTGNSDAKAGEIKTGISFSHPLSADRFKKDVPITESEPMCPYCKKVLDNKPKRKSKCTFCGNDIFIRSKPRIFPYTHLTKDDSIALDWYNKLEWQGIEQRDFLQKRDELSKTNKDIKSTEVIFHLLKNELLNSKDIYRQRVNNFELALFLYETGGEFFRYLSDSQKCRLIEYKRSGLEKVRISSVGGCEACINLTGSVLTIKEALERMPIPVKECANSIKDGRPGWCRCIYVAFFDDPL